MRGKRSLQQRIRPERPERRRYLIYCEDEKAGVDYLRGIKSDLRAQIKIGSQHGEPFGLVKAAVDHKYRASKCREDRFTEYDEIWCVVDVEAPIEHPGLDKALRLAAEHDIDVALANPCFELWLMLHFEAVTAHHDSSRIQTVLQQRGFCGYSSVGKSIEYSSLRGKYETARVNALSLRRDQTSDFRSNPWTNIDELVEQLKQFGAGHGGDIAL